MFSLPSNSPHFPHYLAIESSLRFPLTPPIILRRIVCVRVVWLTFMDTVALAQGPDEEEQQEAAHPEPWYRRLCVEGSGGAN